LGLKEAGHDIRIVTHDCFEAMVRSYGLEVSTVPVDVDPKVILESEAGQRWLGSGQNALSLVLALLPLADRFVRQCMMACWRACIEAEAIIVSWVGFYLGCHIAEKLRVPLMRAYLQPLTPTRAFPNAFVPTPVAVGDQLNLMTHFLYWRFSWHLLRPKLNVIRRELLDMPPLPPNALFSDLYSPYAMTLYGYSPSLLPKPPDWSDLIYVTGYWSLNLSQDWQPDPALVEFLEAGPAPVYVGFGSMKDRNPAASIELAVKALAGAKQRGILLTDWDGISNSDLPDDIFKVERVPHDWLFPQMAAVVHHGGAGTIATALRAEVPSITVPFFADQTFWGRLIHKLGAGTRPIPRRQLSAARLAHSIRSVVSDTTMRKRAAILGGQIRAEDGVARAVEAVNEYLSLAELPNKGRPYSQTGKMTGAR
jgi:UDP:flavonoid glycosyltransferase YjiC (YdhE family)